MASTAVGALCDLKPPPPRCAALRSLMQTQQEKALRQQLAHLQQQVDQLNHKQVELLGQKQSLQAAHQQELARYGHLRTAGELQEMLERLQQQLDTQSGHALKAVVRGCSCCLLLLVCQHAQHHHYPNVHVCLHMNDGLASRVLVATMTPLPLSPLQDAAAAADAARQEAQSCRAQTTAANKTIEALQVRFIEAGGVQPDH